MRLKERLRPEPIGNPDCPLINRWTLFSGRRRFDLKLMIHHFLPRVEDLDTHDHPRSFATLVLRGEYENWEQCEECLGEGWKHIGVQHWEMSTEDPNPWIFAGPGTVKMVCPECGGSGEYLGEVMRRGMVRFRQAEHSHRTVAGPQGAWTVVVMGPARRDWGFWREGRWYQWAEYLRRFGVERACD